MPQHTRISTDPAWAICRRHLRGRFTFFFGGGLEIFFVYN